MSGRGIVEAETWRTQQIEAEERSSDPPNAAVGDWWVRIDIKPSIDTDNVNTLGALRIQGSGGVLQVPLVNSSDSPYLGEDVYIGPQFQFGTYANDGISGSSVGFVPVTDQGGAKGSPRAVSPTGVVYEAHDDVELSAIPDAEGFEHNDLTGRYGGDTENAAIQNSFVSEGSFALEIDGGGSLSAIVRDTSQKSWARSGIRMTWDQYDPGSNSGGGGPLFACQSVTGSSSLDCYAAYVDALNDRIDIRRIDVGSTTVLNSDTTTTVQSGTLLQGQLDMFADDSLEFTFDGTTITTTDSTYASGFLGFHSFQPVYIDNVQFSVI